MKPIGRGERDVRVSIPIGDSCHGNVRANICLGFNGTAWAGSCHGFCFYVLFVVGYRLLKDTSFDAIARHPVVLVCKRVHVLHIFLSF